MKVVKSTIHTRTVLAEFTEAEWLLVQRACFYFGAVHTSLSDPGLIITRAIKRMFQGDVPKEFWEMTTDDFDKMGR